MEALQMLKFSLKMKRLDFTLGLSTLESDMLVSTEQEVDITDNIDVILAVVGQGDEDDM